MTQRNERASLTIGVLLFVIGAVIIAGAAASYALQSGQAQDVTDSEFEDRDVDIVFEQQENMVYVAANGGADLQNVTSFRVTGADMNDSIDPTAEYPEAWGTMERPTVVTVEANFEDGTNQIVGQRRFE